MGRGPTTQIIVRRSSAMLTAITSEALPIGDASRLLLNCQQLFMFAGGIARAIYLTTSGRRIVVLHALEKRTQRTPRRSLDVAKRRMQEFLSSDTEL